MTEIHSMYEESSVNMALQKSGHPYFRQVLKLRKLAKVGTQLNQLVNFYLENPIGAG